MKSTATNTRARLLDENAKVHSTTSAESPVVAELHVGAEFELGQAVDAHGVKWVVATLPGGRQGYIIGTTRVYLTRRVQLVQDSVDVRESPSLESEAKTTLQKGDWLTLLNVKQQGDMKWCEVRTDSSEIGFIPADTKLDEIGIGESVKFVGVFVLLLYVLFFHFRTFLEYFDSFGMLGLSLAVLMILGVGFLSVGSFFRSVAGERVGPVLCIVFGLVLYVWTSYQPVFFDEDPNRATLADAAMHARLVLLGVGMILSGIVSLLIALVMRSRMSNDPPATPVT